MTEIRASGSCPYSPQPAVRRFPNPSRVPRRRRGRNGMGRSDRGLNEEFIEQGGVATPHPRRRFAFSPLVFFFCVRCYVFSCLSLCSSFFGFRLFRSARFIFVYSFLLVWKFPFLFFSDSRVRPTTTSVDLIVCLPLSLTFSFSPPWTCRSYSHRVCCMGSFSSSFVLRRLWRQVRLRPFEAKSQFLVYRERE